MDERLSGAPPFGLVLAGGAGRRLGGVDKAFVAVAGEVLVARVLARLLPQVARAAISANGDPARFAAFGLPVLADGEAAGQGPVAGLLAGLAWAEAAEADRLLTVAVDTPFFPADLGARLLAAGHLPAVAAGPGGGRHPTFALWPVAARPRLSAAAAGGERRLSALLSGFGAAEVRFPAAGPCDPFFNLNTPADRDEAEAIARVAGG